MESITLVVTLLMFSTGIIPCYHMYKTRSTRNVPYHMFLLGTLGCLGMFHYGLMVQNSILVFLNGVGALLQSLYTFLYIFIVRSKTLSLFYLLLAIIYDTVLYVYMFRVLVPAERADFLGTCSSLLTTCIMLLPILEVIHNIRHKNADGMPAVMLIGGTVCSSCWLVYGIMLGDPNIYSPNIPGIFISTVKLYLIFLYGGSRNRRRDDRDDDDDGEKED